MAEKLLLRYALYKKFSNEDENAIGPTTSTILRSITSHNDSNCKYVKKFGTDYAINDITNVVITTPRSDGGGTNKWWYEFYNQNDTLLATVKDELGSSTFVDGTAEASTMVYIKIVRKSGNTNALADGDTISLTTDVDSPLTVYIPGENMSAGSPASDEVVLYLSKSGSTYYDQNYKYGGYRHTPTGTIKYPYFDPQSAWDQLGGAFTIVTVLDSESYDYSLDLNIATKKIQADLGQAPKLIVKGIGPRATREVTQQYNNVTGHYWNENGNDSNPGTWQEPRLTIGAGRGTGQATVYGGVGATENPIISTSVILFHPTEVFVAEPDYGYVPTLKASGNYALWISFSIKIYGFKFTGNGTNRGIDQTSVVPIHNFIGELKDLSFDNLKYGHFMWNDVKFNGVMTRNIYKNCEMGIRMFRNDQGAGTIEENIFHNNSTGIYVLMAVDNYTLSINYKNNIFYSNSVGMYFRVDSGETLNGSIENNTIAYNTIYGIQLDEEVGATIGIVTKDNIIYFNGIQDLYGEGNISPTFTYTHYGSQSGWTAGTGASTDDPKFCLNTAPYKLGLNSDSTAYRSDSGSDDRGAHLRGIEINASTIEINGFYIEGSEHVNNLIYILDTDNHTGLVLKWNSIRGAQGIAVDLYDDNTDLFTEVYNCMICYNGNGMRIPFGNNKFEENIIHNNSIYGIWSDGSTQIFDHNVFFGNAYGIYFGNSGTGISIRNSIFHLNSVYSIYSELGASIYYSCNTDKLNNVNDSDSTNISSNPLFVNTNLGSEDFHIKTSEGGFLYDSPCKNAGESDIGAYIVDRDVAEWGYRTYQLENNPYTLDPSRLIKGQVNFENALGTLTVFGKGHKRLFTLQYDDNDNQSDIQKNTLEYIASIIQTRENGLTEEQCIVLLSLLPDQKLFTGSAGIVNSTTKNLGDTSISIIPDRYKGFSMGIKFTTGSGMVVSASGKTATKSGAGWTIDQFKGYFLPIGIYIYYILSNSATVLTLSDPFETLVDGTINFSIEKYFRILSHSKDSFLLEDEDDELINGTYAYYIDFIKTKVMNNIFQPLQEGFDFEKEESKTGFNLILQEF